MYRYSKSDLNLNSYNLFASKKPYLKDPPFSNKNCDWYERHATLWEQFIKDHLLIGKRLASDNESVGKNNNFSQSQHFHVDPKKCKEISIELKNNIDKSVVISFVTSESSLKTVLPSDLENSKAIKVRNITTNKDIKRNYLSNNIKFKRSSKDISIDTKSLESHLNNSQNNNNLVNNLQEVNKCKESNINITDYSKKYTDSSFIPKIDNGRISEFSVTSNGKKSNQRNLNNKKPRFLVKVRSQNKLKVHQRTPPSKSSFIKYPHNFSNSLPINVDKINQKQKEHLNINIWKRGDRVINEKSVSPNFALNEKILIDKKLEIKASNKKEPRDSFEKGDNIHEELLELKKKDSDKSNSSTKIEDTKFQLKKNNNKASDTKESTGWFSFPKIFHIFNPKNEPIAKDNKKRPKLEKSQTVTKLQNKSNFNTYKMPRKSSPLRQDSDGSNNGDYFKYRHINHKTHYRSKSRGRAKGQPTK
uniref:Uncharacterized protein n=1 Tax=Clastoptera arizonana TaxID=38151 RepID=A0A1B6D8V6_9HEMI